MSLENTMKMINDKLRIKAIQSRVFTDKTKQAFNISTIKDKYLKATHIPNLYSNTYHANKPKSNSALIIQTLLNKYKPNAIALKDHSSTIKNQSHNDRYSKNEKEDTYTHKDNNNENVHYSKIKPSYTKDKQVSLLYPQKPKEKAPQINEAIPFLDFSKVMSQIPQYESQRKEHNNHHYHNSSQISFGMKDVEDSSSNRNELCPIRKRIDWLKREKKHIKSQINSYSSSQIKIEKTATIDRNQVECYLDEFFNYNDENTLQNQFILNHPRMPNLLQRSVLKISLPNFHSIH